jgi:hypothetical protein
MNIILGKENVEDLGSKYTILELDTLLINGAQDPVIAYCLIENVPIDQISTMDQYTDLHHNLMSNYRKRNWRYCEDALEHLVGKWGGELDTFYHDMHQRINTLKEQDLDESWTGYIAK